jgi:gliding motility-associated-like protein
MRPFLFLVLLLVPFWAGATHNRAGEITYEQIGPLTIRATITTYTKASSVAADRDSLTFFWGDGTSTTAARSVEIILQNDTKFNQYVAVHTYPGNGIYYISMVDPNRNGGILNVNFPFSDQVQFFLQTEVRFLNLQFQGPNSSPVLLQPPVDIGCVGKIFQHTPNAYDPDGDSLAYELASPLQSINSPVPNYVFVDQVVPGPNNTYTFDPVTGLFTWTFPQQAGEYNIGILVKSYRNGALVGTILRDMQILILSCNDNPPTIQAPPDRCVVAGDLVEFTVNAADADPGDLVEISATGGPFEVANSPAVLLDFTNPGNPAQVLFRWQTVCDHIQDQYHQVAFKAQDDFQDTTGLPRFDITRIKVVGPPPQGFTATPASGQVELCWDAPYACEGSGLFRGFTVWRKDFCAPLPPDPCLPDLGALGYTRISVNNVTQVSPGGRYCYVDNTIQRGSLYTYAVQAEFAPLSAGGFPYNPVSGLPSEQLCVQTARDIPLVTNVDVAATDVANGSVFVQWSKPEAEDLDTLLNPGPYRYELYRANGFTGANALVAQFSSPFFQTANDTSFLQTGLNTLAQPHNYKVAFWVQDTVLLGETFTASSVFLSVAPTDNANRLSWRYQVPWGNYRFEVFRRDPGAGAFVLLASTTDTVYLDEGLSNGETYCYYVRAEGTYNIAGILSPLFNRSQEACGIPRDNVPPCPPDFWVQGCDTADTVTPEQELRNLVAWSDPGACGRDIARYNIYFAPPLDSVFQPVGTILRGEDPAFVHLPSVGNLAGCYYVTAVDSVDLAQGPVPSGGNESLPGDTVCVDNCPLYRLPNVFTPNGDGANERFVPFRPLRFIAAVDFKVFNRWGELVWQTADPDLGWDGTDQRTGTALAEGVYYYTCLVQEQRLEGPIALPELLSGYIHLMRGND